MKRKFSRKRLFTLVKSLVIAISVISWIFFLYSHSKRDLVTELSFRQYDLCRETYGDLWKIDSSFKKAYDDCVLEVTNEIILQGKLEQASILIGIFLPLVFFGGVAVYRYLFPEIKKEKNEKE